MNLISMLKTFLQANVIQPSRRHGGKGSIQKHLAPLIARHLQRVANARQGSRGLPNISLDTLAFRKELN